MKEKLLRITSNKYVYYGLFFCLILLIHQFFYFSNDDVTFFSTVLDNYTIGEYLSFRYNNWTSRLLIEGLLVFLSRSVHLWRILNSLVICLLIYTIDKLFLNNSKGKSILFIMLLFLLYPYYQMAEAGFCATTLNYLWPFTFFLFSLIPLRNLYDGKKISKKMLPLYLIAFIFSCNQEQVVCVALLVSFIFLIYCIRKKIKKWYSILLLIISFVSLIFILTCPGNEIRTVTEIANCYPDYVNADLFDKLYLGVVSTCSVLISNFLIIWLFSFILFCIILVVKKNIIIKIINWLQFIIITVISIFRVFIILTADSFLDGYSYGIYGYFSEIGDVFQFSFMNLFVLFVCLGMILIYCILLCNLFENNKIGVILFLLISCVTRLIMGFSPTVFASGTRTMIFLNFSLLIIILLLHEKYYLLFSKKKLSLFYIIILIFIIVNYILTFVALPLLSNT